MRISVKVKSGSGKPEVSGNRVIVFTKAKRENNKANLDVIKQLSRLFKINPEGVKLVEGRTSTSKIFEIPDNSTSNHKEK